jgi:hypothetical protein
VASAVASASDGAGTHGDAELEQLAGDPLGAPVGVLAPWWRSESGPRPSIAADRADNATASTRTGASPGDARAAQSRAGQGGDGVASSPRGGGRAARRACLGREGGAGVGTGGRLEAAGVGAGSRRWCALARDQTGSSTSPVRNVARGAAMAADHRCTRIVGVQTGPRLMRQVDRLD